MLAGGAMKKWSKHTQILRMFLGSECANYVFDVCFVRVSFVYGCGPKAGFVKKIKMTFSV
jgi:hypothetical protein